MIIKQLVDEDFINYKKPSIFIGFPICNWKCEKECGKQVCQNGTLAQAPDIEIRPTKIVERYKNNPITKAIVFGGLEPFDSWNELFELVKLFRTITLDDIVIYTGYKEEEINNKIRYLQAYKNIIIKFGRFIPNQSKHFDNILGVELASNNQYARRIS